MHPIKSVKNLKRREWALWAGSVAAILIAFLIAGEKDILTVITSVLGATSLIFVAKGDALGQLIMIIFAVLYAVISYTFRYYGAMLTVLRSDYYAVAYAANDIVLIILWILACFKSLSYLPMVVCFAVFFVNDLYGFFNRQKMKRRQRSYHLLEKDF